LVRTQDQELYKELVRRYQDKLRHYAGSLIGNEDKAADVVQEAFIKAFVNLRGFKIKKKFSSWIYRITHNEAINQIKKYKREVPLENNKQAEKAIIKQALKNNSEVEINFEKQEVQEILNACLKELPLKYRSPLVLFYLEEKSYEEISDVLRIPVGTVGTWINRGKKLMATLCQKKGGEIYGEN